MNVALTMMNCALMMMSVAFKMMKYDTIQICQLWVTDKDEDQFSKFLSAIFNGITNGDGSLQDIVSTKNGKSYKLSSLDSVKSIANKNGTLTIPGVKTNNVLGGDEGDSVVDDGGISVHVSPLEEIIVKKVKKKTIKRKITAVGKVLSMMESLTQRPASANPSLGGSWGADGSWIASTGAGGLVNSKWSVLYT